MTGGSLSNAVVATATSTIYGWVAGWNTTTVPNGMHTLRVSTPMRAGQRNQCGHHRHRRQSAADDYRRAAVQPGHASGPVPRRHRFAGVTNVMYEVTGEASRLCWRPHPDADHLWMAGDWDTTTVPNGTYALQSVASYAGGVSAPSTPITIWVTS